MPDPYQEDRWRDGLILDFWLRGSGSSLEHVDESGRKSVYRWVPGRSRPLGAWKMSGVCGLDRPFWFPAGLVNLAYSLYFKNLDARLLAIRFNRATCKPTRFSLNETKYSFTIRRRRSIACCLKHDVHMTHLVVGLSLASRP